MAVGRRCCARFELMLDFVEFGRVVIVGCFLGLGGEVFGTGNLVLFQGARARLGWCCGGRVGRRAVQNGVAQTRKAKVCLRLLLEL